MPRADDLDGDVTGRAGVTDAFPVVSGFFDSGLDTDTDLVPVCDTAPDAVHGTGSVQQSFAGPEANPNADATANSYADPTATAQPDSQPMPNVVTGGCPDTAASNNGSSVDGSGCRAEFHAQQTGDRHLFIWGKSSHRDDDRHLRWRILDQLHRGIDTCGRSRHSDRH
jgi:hypothetical protein